jgi:hypothetical protein
MGFWDWLSGAASETGQWASDNPVQAVTALASLASLFDPPEPQSGMGSNIDDLVDQYFENNLNATIGISIGGGPPIQIPTRAARELANSLVGSGQAQRSGSALDQIRDIVSIGSAFGQMGGPEPEPEQEPTQTTAPPAQATDRATDNNYRPTNYSNALAEMLGFRVDERPRGTLGTQPISRTPFTDMLRQSNPEFERLLSMLGGM